VTDPASQHGDQRDRAYRGSPDDPVPVAHPDAGSAEPEDAIPQEEEAHLVERREGANEEKIGDEATFRDDDTAPGVDPGEAT
jgi:hypothetical protein